MADRVTPLTEFEPLSLKFGPFANLDTSPAIPGDAADCVFSSAACCDRKLRNLQVVADDGGLVTIKSLRLDATILKRCPQLSNPSS